MVRHNLRLCGILLLLTITINSGGANSIYFTNITGNISETPSDSQYNITVYIDGNPSYDYINQYKLDIYSPSDIYIKSYYPVRYNYSGSYPINITDIEINSSGYGNYRYILNDIANALTLNTTFLYIYNSSNYTAPSTPPISNCDVNSICGYVYDLYDVPIDSATVVIGSNSTFTNYYGYYSINIPYSGGFSYSISAPSYSESTGSQTFYKGTVYNWALSNVSQGSPQYLDFHVTGEGTAVIFKNSISIGIIDNSHDIISMFYIGDSYGWDATPNTNQTFITVCDAEGITCTPIQTNTITITGSVPSQVNIIFSGVQKPNPYNSSNWNTDTLADSIFLWGMSVTEIIAYIEELSLGYTMIGFTIFTIRFFSFNPKARN